MTQRNPSNNRNGWYDSGAALRGTEGKRCPNCGSPDYVESLSREKCNGCGMEFDYWGYGGNAQYESYLAKHYAEQDRIREDRYRRQMEAEWGNGDDWD